MSSSSGRYKLSAEGHCRLCLRPAHVRKLTRHHLVPVRQGGSWTNANIIPLCRPCHDDIDCCSGAERARARSMLRNVLHPGEISYARRVMGAPWLDRNYPPHTTGSDEVEQREHG